MKNFKKFSLIEVLVVVAIMGVLLSLLMPTLKKARGNARLSVCVNNMKQISTGVLMYTMSNDGTPYHTYRSIQDDLADQNILSLVSGAWECPEDKGTWTYNSQNAPMDQNGKTTFEAQKKSYLVNGQFNNMFELKDEDDPSQGETNDSKGNIRNISLIEEPSLYMWSSCAPLRGNYGDNDGTKNLGIRNLWHMGLTKWPMSFADGHVSIISDSRSPTSQLFRASPVSDQFIVKQ